MLDKLVIPQHLKAGDKVATVSLSWGGAGEEKFRARYERGKKMLQDVFGVQVVEMTNTLKGQDYIYNNPQARVDDLYEAFLNPEIKGIISCIGGSDSVRLIDKVDFDIIRNNPKVVLGYSDFTVTNFICLTAGLRSFNGPAIMTQFAENGGMHDYVVQSLRKTIFSNDIIGEVRPSEEGWTVDAPKWEDVSTFETKRKMEPQTGWKYIQGEKPVSGRLIGGCGDVLAMFVGSKIWPKADVWKDAILFIENSEDAMSSDQFLYNMRNLGAQGIIGNAKGILFAKPCRIPLEDWPKYDDVLKQVTAEFGRPDMPIVTRMDFGHTDPIMVMPFGAMATIDPVAKRITINEAGCR